MQEVVFVTVVTARFLLPLLIPRFPLPAILACLVLDGYDQSIFQAFGYDPPGYQSYDKAMDVFYLSIAYLSILRNWASLPAVVIAQFLFYYRMVGAFLFELTDERWMLLVFPNTFEYFFIAYEAWRTLWSPHRLNRQAWLVAAAAIWIVVKLPQEYWLHVAQMDMSDLLAEESWAWPTLIGAVLGILAVFWFAVRPRLPEPDHAFSLSSGPIPAAVDNSAARAAIHLAGGWVLSWITFEKIVLIGVVSVIYGQVLPGVSVSTPRLFTAIAVMVAINAAITVLFSRRNWTIESAAAAVVARLGVNVGLMLVADLLGRNAGGWDTFFFLSLVSLMTTLHDRYQPVYAWRRARERALVAESLRTPL